MPETQNKIGRENPGLFFVQKLVCTICFWYSNLYREPVYHHEAETVLLSVCHIVRRSQDTSGGDLYHCSFHHHFALLFWPGDNQDTA
jgi:hypothetical protein